MTENRKTAGRVPLLIPIDPRGEVREVYLAVNGRSMLVKTGEPVEVPPEFAEVYNNAAAQRMAALRKQAELEKQAESSAV